MQNNIPPIQNNGNPAQESIQGEQLSSDVVNELINSVSNTNEELFKLPSNHIPNTHSQIQHDNSATPNYVPQNKKVQFIEEHNERNGELINNFQNNVVETNKINQLYDEYQLPIILSVLFFLFTLPFINKNIKLHFPSFFHKEGGITITGNIFKSLLYGLTYFMMNKGLEYLSEI